MLDVDSKASDNRGRNAAYCLDCVVPIGDVEARTARLQAFAFQIKRDE